MMFIVFSFQVFIYTTTTTSTTTSFDLRICPLLSLGVHYPVVKQLQAYSLWMNTMIAD